MIEIEKPRIDCEQLAEDGSYGKFVVEPLERGYGTHPAVVSAWHGSVQHQDRWCAARVFYDSGR